MKSIDSPPLKQGQIFWLEVQPPGWTPMKRRPVVLIDSPEIIASMEPALLVVPCSTSSLPFPETVQVQLNPPPRAHNRTGLARVCFAVVSSVFPIERAKLERAEWCGQLGPKMLVEIVRLLTADDAHSGQ